MPGTRRHCLKVINRRGVALSLLAIATIATAYTAVPPVATISGRLISACSAWITPAGALETLSALGFVLVFKLLFGARLGWRQTFGASPRALGARTLLPAGPIVGPAMGARSARGLGFGGRQRRPTPQASFGPTAASHRPTNARRRSAQGGGPSSSGAPQ